MIREGQCENCLAEGPVQECKVRDFGIEDAIWLCEECGGYDAQDYEREQDEEPEDKGIEIYEI